MTIIEVIKNVIQSKHGWAVAEHFQCTIENVELFDEQDKNALKYINDTITIRSMTWQKYDNIMHLFQII